MKRILYIIVLAVLVLLSIKALPVYAHWSHPHYGGTVWVGPRWGVWSPGWWGAPAYDYYQAPPVVIQQEPPVYVQPPSQVEEHSYWYYCRQPQGYYPYVKRCPGGWLKVFPSPVPEDEEGD